MEGPAKGCSEKWEDLDPYITPYPKWKFIQLFTERVNSLHGNASEFWVIIFETKNY